MQWKIALYIRLSREDGNEESLSVSNQRKILLDYLEQDFGEPYELKEICIDDGKSGTDAARPGFQRLLHLIAAGEVNCVLCKNLSRAFRNYADQGYFLETYFPKYQTRFLTVGEPKIDTFLHPEALWGLEIPINGILNDRYACKTSADIRRTFQTKRRKGEFIGAFAPYGYLKDPKCKNHLLPDPEAARVVQQIFHWYVHCGCSKNAIAQALNRQQIPNPTAYKRQKGFAYHHPQMEKNDGLWQSGTISSILSNEIYLGTMVQGKQKTLSYKIHDRTSVPAENWVKVPHTHEPLISTEDFLLAQQRMNVRQRSAPNSQSPHLFSGLLRCADCGKAMTRTRTKNYVYFHCSTYKRKSKTLCTPHTIRQDILEEILLSLIQTFWLTLLPFDAIEKSLREQKDALSLFSCAENKISQKQTELQQTCRILDDLYLDWKKGFLSKEQYLRLKESCTLKKNQLESILKEMTQHKTSALPMHPHLEAFYQQNAPQELTYELLAALVQKIEIEENNAIRVHFGFQNPFVGQIGLQQ